MKIKKVVYWLIVLLLTYLIVVIFNYFKINDSYVIFFGVISQSIYIQYLKNRILKLENGIKELINKLSK